MSKKVSPLALIVSLALLISFAAGLHTGKTAMSSPVPEPGSAGDPLITLSYLQAYLQEHGGGGGGSTTASFKVVSVKPGQMIEGGEGTELILRAGIAEAVSNSSGNGISNISVGKDLLSGERLSMNQLLIVPRADGRGARVPASSTMDAIFMVRGPYTVK
jgi:hypothetical protein